MSEAGRIAVSGEGAGAQMVLAGQWTLSHHSVLRRQLAGVRASPVRAFDTSALGALDTAGAALLLEAFGAERARHLAAALAPPQRALLTAVIDAMQSGEASAQAPHGTALGDVLERIQILAQQKHRLGAHTLGSLEFVGRFADALGQHDQLTGGRNLGGRRGVLQLQGGNAFCALQQGWRLLVDGAQGLSHLRQDDLLPE